MAEPATIAPRHAWVIAKLLFGHGLNGELAALPESLRPAARHLASLSPDDRGMAFRTIADSLPEGDALAVAVARVDPAGPCPEPDEGGAAAPPRRPATLADLPVLDASDWTWPSWIPGAAVFGVGGFEGTGKSRFALDLARRAWQGLPWPDGQAATLPPRSRTLWLCSDGQQDELAAAADAFDLPREAVALTSLPADPHGGSSLDDPETLALMAEFLGTERFAFAFVDSLTYATSSDMNRANEMRAVGTPLRDLAQSSRTPIGLLLHLNKEGSALGRRVQGLTRTLLRLDCPDPEGAPARLKLSVPKSFAAKPPPLGVTMGDAGNEYDHTPPSPPPEPPRGRAPVARDKAVAFMVDKLAGGDRKLVDLIADWESLGNNKTAAFDAKKLLEADGRITVDTSRKPQVVHLNDAGGSVAC